jgi:hypothetical protein
MSKEIDLEIDDNWNGTLVMTCPKCKAKTRRRISSLASGSKVRSSCGHTTFEMSGDDLRRVQRSLDDLKRDIDGFGK